jgi:hypothetical protein
MNTATGRLLLTTALVLTLIGCASINAKSTQYVGAPHFGPTDPSCVEILREAPAKAHDKLGEIRIDASTEPSPPVGDIENKLRDEGAKLGANAVVIVYDRIQPVGANVSGPWWNSDVQVITDQRMIAVAIRYR